MTDRRPVHRFIARLVAGRPGRHCSHRFDDGVLCAAEPESPIHNISAAMDAAAGPRIRVSPDDPKNYARAPLAQRQTTADRERWQRLVNAVAGAFNAGTVPGSDAESVEWAIDTIQAKAQALAFYEQGDAVRTIQQQAAEIAELRRGRKSALLGWKESNQQNAALREALLVAQRAMHNSPATFEYEIPIIDAALKGTSDE